MPAHARILTELEGSVLGTLHALGPSTAYEVRRVFRDSPSPYWSGSAGAIYPLIERLNRRGLVRSSAHATGRRRHRLNELTTKGRAALRSWLRLSATPWVVGVPADPLRTRLTFVSVLPPGERLALLTDAARQMTAHRRAIEADVARARRQQDLYAWLVARGALSAVRSRQRWLKEVVAVLDGAAANGWRTG